MWVHAVDRKRGQAQICLHKSSLGGDKKLKGKKCFSRADCGINPLYLDWPLLCLPAGLSLLQWNHRKLTACVQKALACLMSSSKR